ncbi:MAG: Crp/Fnr family transcriptional regulator [Acidobacteriota bacterium]|nr:Crp/Fnr family transcriptional regulator [Acidobacteriota bacterium]
MKTLVQVLGALPLFSRLSPDELGRLAALGGVQRYEKNQVIFNEGEPGVGFHVVLGGRVKVFKSSAEGREQILHIWTAGEIFGEVPVFAGGSYPASALALDAVRTFFLPRDGLLTFLRQRPELALKLLAALARRLHHFAGVIEDLSLREVPSRLAAYLLDLHAVEKGAQPVVELEISRGQLASLLGTIPETLSRIFSRLAREGLLEPLSARRLRLLDPEALAQLADRHRGKP